MVYNPNLYQSQAKRDRTPTHQWVKHMIGKAYTGDQWTEMFKAQDDKWKLEKLIETHVDKKIIQDNQGVIVNLSLNGVMHKQFIQTNALPEHEDDSGDS